MKRLFTILLFACAFSPMADAQVTLDECRDMARRNHPAIRMYGIIGATEECSLSNASRQWLPSVRIGALGGIYNNVVSVEDMFSRSENPTISNYVVNEVLYGMMNVQEPSPYTYKIQAELSQRIYDGGASGIARQIARAESQVQSAETDVTLQQVCSRVDEIYFSILLLEKRILQADSRIVLLSEIRERTEHLFQAGAVRQDEPDEIAAACIEAQQQKTDLESAVKSFRLALSLLAGKDLTDCELLMPSDSPSPQTVPELLLLDRRMELLALEKNRLDVAARPHLDLVADAYYGYPNRNFFRDLVSHDPGLNAFLGLSLSWSPTALYTRKNDKALISNSIERTGVQKDIMKMDIRLQNVESDAEIERLDKCIGRDNELIAIRERLRKSAELSYSQGDISADRFLSRIDDEYQARLNADIHEIERLREMYRLKEE